MQAHKQIKSHHMHWTKLHESFWKTWWIYRTWTFIYCRSGPSPCFYSMNPFIYVYLYLSTNPFPSNFYHDAFKVNAVRSFSYPQKNYIFNFYHLPQATVNCILKLPTSVHHNGKSIPRTGSRETQIKKKKLNYRV